MKILIAEDSSTVRRLVTARLTADGYEVVEAADGEEALRGGRPRRPPPRGGGVYAEAVQPARTVSEGTACARARVTMILRC